MANIGFFWLNDFWHSSQEEIWKIKSLSKSVISCVWRLRASKMQSLRLGISVSARKRSRRSLLALI